MNTIKTLILAIAIVCSGCVRPALSPASGSIPAMMKSEIFFGRLQPKRKEVTDEQWKNFTPKIAHCFPQGFTIIDGTGNWRKKNGTVDHERSKVVVAVYSDTEEKRSCINKIKLEYKKQFLQEAVLEVITPVSAAF